MSSIHVHIFITDLHSK